MANVLVTGGTGFVGKRLVNALVDAGHSVRVLARNKKYVSQNENIEVIYGDISDKTDVLEAVGDVEIVYHLAAAMSGEMEIHKSVTIEGTRNIIDACNKSSITHLLYVSTLNVYDSNLYKNGIEINEDFPYEKHSEYRGYYSYAKLFADKLVSENSISAKYKTTIFRPGLIYGNRQNLIPKDVAIHLLNNIYAVIGMGKRRLPFIFVDNLLDAMLLAINKQKKRCDIFNLVDNEYPTQQDYIEMLNRVTPEKIIWFPVPLFIVKTCFGLLDILFNLMGKHKHLLFRLNALVKSPNFTCKHANEALQWRQKITLEKALAKIIRNNIID